MTHVKYFILACIILILSLSYMPITTKAIYWSYFRPHELFPASIAVMDYSEYRPRDVPLDIFSIEGISRLAATNPPARLKKGVGDISIAIWGPEHFVLNVDLETEGQIQLHQFYYRGWHAHAIPSSEPLSTNFDLDTGLLLVNAPSGKYKIDLVIEKSLPEQVGLFISTCAVIILLWSLASKIRLPNRCWKASKKLAKPVP
jgi:hypothetical protein